MAAKHSLIGQNMDTTDGFEITVTDEYRSLKRMIADGFVNRVYIIRYKITWLDEIPDADSGRAYVDTCLDVRVRPTDNRVAVLKSSYQPYQ